MKRIVVLTPPTETATAIDGLPDDKVAYILLYDPIVGSAALRLVSKRFRLKVDAVIRVPSFWKTAIRRCFPLVNYDPKTENAFLMRILWRRLWVRLWNVVFNRFTAIHASRASFSPDILSHRRTQSSLDAFRDALRAKRVITASAILSANTIHEQDTLTMRFNTRKRNLALSSFCAVWGASTEHFTQRTLLFGEIFTNGTVVASFLKNGSGEKVWCVSAVADQLEDDAAEATHRVRMSATMWPSRIDAHFLRRMERAAWQTAASAQLRVPVSIELESCTAR